MSVLFRGLKKQPTRVEDLIPDRAALGVDVAGELSLASGVRWACQRLRADLVSTIPLTARRLVAASGIHQVVDLPPVLTLPDGVHDVSDWLWMSTFELDAYGNAFAIVAERDDTGRPARLRPVSAEDVGVHIRDGELDHYTVRGRRYEPEQMWHERQYPAPGSPMGMSPLAWAAMALGGHMSASRFVRDWFAGNAIPSAHFKNTAKTLTGKQIDDIKARYARTVRNGGVLVTGSDWDFHPMGASASEAAFTEALRVTGPEICRFFGVPGDLVDVAMDGSSMTYANVTQRQLGLLTMHLGPMITRRERAFTHDMVPRGQTVLFETDAFLRMDPVTRRKMLADSVAARLSTVTEARRTLDLPPLDAADVAEFNTLFGVPRDASPTPGERAVIGIGGNW